VSLRLLSWKGCDLPQRAYGFQKKNYFHSVKKHTQLLNLLSSYAVMPDSAACLCLASARIDFLVVSLMTYLLYWFSV
jgi:hypothetical protein